jgi:hypothetical protein
MSVSFASLISAKSSMSVLWMQLLIIFLINLSSLFVISAGSSSLVRSRNNDENGSSATMASLDFGFDIF